MASFIDRVEIDAHAGAGGRGCVSFRREKFVPRGGPNGGDGGAGGDVILVGNRNLTTLLDFTSRQRFDAGGGEPGRGSNQSGAEGETLRLQVPLGTIVTGSNGLRLGEVLENGAELVVARGGKGGRGNTFFKSSTHQAPRMAQPGLPGESQHLVLELKLIADAGLVGKPNAGKSTLLAAVSAATPKIADYPFTTLSPVLGVVDAGEDRSFVLADIPGLLEGAHEGRGLGLDFLRHVERTRVLVFVLDVAADDVLEDYQVLRHELRTYAPELETRRRIIALNKIDLRTADEIVAIRARLPAEDDVVPISGATRRGLRDLLLRVVNAIDHARDDELKAEAASER
jgi:GTP-binding protein